MLLLILLQLLLASPSKVETGELEFNVGTSSEFESMDLIVFSTAIDGSISERISLLERVTTDRVGEIWIFCASRTGTTWSTGTAGTDPVNSESGIRITISSDGSLGQARSISSGITDVSYDSFCSATSGITGNSTGRSGSASLYSKENFEWSESSTTSATGFAGISSSAIRVVASLELLSLCNGFDRHSCSIVGSGS